MSVIYLPKKINVGYRKRTDTFTGQLAYIIYYDEKGVLRKEKSWQTWRDEKIDNTVFDNVPTEGFVLNKKVGGHSSGWNHRQTYTRIYDPRGFEFEITVPNLLYILENSNCMRGKGLEGKFIYGWQGTELVLIPENAPEYAEHLEYSAMLESGINLKGKDLILGAVYRSKESKDYVYLGRFDYYDSGYKDNVYHSNINKGKHYYFRDLASTSRYGRYFITKGLSKKIIKVVSDTPVANYADLMDELEGSTYYSPHDKLKDEIVPATIEDLQHKLAGNSNITVYIDIDGIELVTHLSKVYDYEKGGYLDGMFYVQNNLKRTTDLPDSEFDYSEGHKKGYQYVGGSYSYSSISSGVQYSNKYRCDLKLKEIEERLSTWTGDRQTNHYSLEELHNHFNFKIKKEYLENGKEKR